MHKVGIWLGRSNACVVLSGDGEVAEACVCFCVALEVCCAGRALVRRLRTLATCRWQMPRTPATAQRRALQSPSRASPERGLAELGTGED